MTPTDPQARLRALEAKVNELRANEATALQVRDAAQVALKDAQTAAMQAGVAWGNATNALQAALREYKQEAALWAPLTPVQRRVLLNAAEGSVADSVTAAHLHKCGFLTLARQLRSNAPPRYTITQLGLEKLGQGTPKP